MFALKWFWDQSWDKAPPIGIPKKARATEKGSKHWHVKNLEASGWWFPSLRWVLPQSMQNRWDWSNLSVKFLVRHAFCLFSVDASFTADWNSLESLDSWFVPGASDMDGPVRFSFQNLTSFTVRNVSINISPSLAFWTHKNYIFTDISKVLRMFSKELLLYSLLKDCGFSLLHFFHGIYVGGYSSPWRGQRTAFNSQFSSIIGVSGIELRAWWQAPLPLSHLGGPFQGFLYSQ